MDVSFVMPAYNEEGNVGTVLSEIAAVMRRRRESYEIIVVDDGSTDRTRAEALKARDPRVKVVSFTRNFRKAAALMAGFERAEGKVVVTLDADGQDDPREIPKLLGALKDADMAVGWKRKRKDPLSRRLSSWVFNAMVRVLTGVSIHDSDCNFRAMRRKVAKSLHIYGGLYRYIPSIASDQGFRVVEIPVHHRARQRGKSKYGPGRLFYGFFDLITVVFLLAYRHSPMHLFAIPGALFVGTGIVVGAYLSVLRLGFGQEIGSRPLLLLAVLLVVVGLQFFSMGLLGEMVRSRQREAQYVVRE